MTQEELMAEINEKITKRDDLMKMLERSLAIQKLWPDPQWPVSSFMQGRPGNYRLVLRDATDDFKEFSVDQIPPILREAPHIDKAFQFMKRWDQESFQLGTPERRHQNV